MGLIAVPSTGPHDWQRVLADPELHWRSSASAMSLAASWEAAAGDFPPEVRQMLASSSTPELQALRALLIIPEFPVALPGGARPSMTDVFVLATGPCGVVAIAVEGKVNEPFGPLVGEKRQGASHGQLTRLAFLQDRLGLAELPDDIRYQLLHRSVSAVLAAEQFGAKAAVMLVHSFSEESRWFGDFAHFAQVLGLSVQKDHLYETRLSSPKLFIGWCCGERRFAEVDLSEATR